MAESLRQNAPMGPLHDVGKIAIPLANLQKKTTLTLAERDQIRYQVSTGAVLLNYYQGSENLSRTLKERCHFKEQSSLAILQKAELLHLLAMTPNLFPFHIMVGRQKKHTNTKRVDFPEQSRYNQLKYLTKEDY